MFVFSHLKRLDWALIICAFLLVGIGLLSLYSSSLGRGNFLNFKKQLIFFALSIFLLFFLSFFDWRILKEDPYLILIFYFLGLFSLIGLYFFPHEIRGVKTWYKLGPISIDPIEFMKIILIVLLAKYFSKRHVEIYRLTHIFISGFYVFLPAVLIFFQPNLGSALILILLWLGILIVSGIKVRHFFLLCLAGILFFIFSWIFLLKDYQKARIVSFLIPYDPLGVSWNQNQAKIAIGSGNIFGQGFGRGSQTQYGFLPEPQTDFIFAAIAEEFGLVGGGFLLFLFGVLLWRIMKIALSAENNFSRLFATGFAIYLISQVFINVGMNLGLLPIIGISLPLVSYGGSSLIATFIGLGILESIKTH